MLHQKGRITPSFLCVKITAQALTLNLRGWRCWWWRFLFWGPLDVAGGFPGGAFAGVVAIFVADDGVEDGTVAHALGHPIFDVGGGFGTLGA